MDTETARAIGRYHQADAAPRKRPRQKEAPDTGGLDRKKCAGPCGKVKPLDAYGSLGAGKGQRTECRTCFRHRMAAYRQTPEWRAWYEAWVARPEVQARRKETDRRRYARRQAAIKAQARPALMKLQSARSSAKGRLAREARPHRIAALEALLAAYDREIARIKKEQDDPCRSRNG